MKWDIFVIDFDTRTINTYRYGAGENRMINY